MHSGYGERGWLSAVMLLLVTGCGGGGDGGGGGGVGSVSPVVYSGNSNAAVISGTNAAKLVTNLVGGDASGTVIVGTAIKGSGPASSGSGGLTGLTRFLNRISRDTLMHAERVRAGLRTVQGVIPIEDIQLCESGQVRISGNLQDNGTGTLSIAYENCRFGNETANGQGTFRVDQFDLGLFFPTDYTMNFASLAIRGPGVSRDVGGPMRVQVNFGANTETITENLVTRNNVTGEMIKTENLVFVTVYDNIFAPSSYSVAINGRIFDSVHGFVDVSTPVPLFFFTLDQPFPNSGQILLTGSGNRAVRVTAQSATTVMLALDLNGDGVFESSATLKWTDLSGPVGANLADTDGDGMHNGWETANGLNPNSSADAAVDSDGDGASNLAEYQGGSNPNDPGSTPPVVGLSLSMQDTPDPAFVGGNLSYSIVVSNSSTGAASNVVLTDTLPASVNLTSPLQPTQGSCSGTTTITCNFGTIGAFGTASIVIGVSPTAEGLISNTATVTTSSFDPNTSDNSVTSTTAVGQPAAGIQGQIDVAVDGQTIDVPAGIYFGGLNFNGKNITLQSIAGPARTILHGNNGAAVLMGPGGTIKGFTITGSSESGIQLFGTGALVSGNIFDGNVLNIGSFGAAIRGNAASATIERNVFRNNTCDAQHLSGVISFVNGSSPVIVNNIFENNQCRGINMTLPQGNAPQVANNTFIGNRAAIYVDRRVPQTTQIYRNNLIVQNEIGLDIVFGGTDADNPVWTNNLVFGNTTEYQGTASQTGINGNISANPMFVNGAAGNYHLQAGSPAIDAGNPVGAPAIDFDGTARPVDGDGNGSAIVDIGAFEAP